MNGTLSKLRLVCIDTNIFIYYFDENPRFGQAAKRIFDELASGNLKAITSTTSLVEILSYKILSKKDAKDMENKFYDIPQLSILDINRSIAVEAGRIRRKYSFRSPDAIQLATALHTKAKAFITNDDRLKKCKEIKILLLDDFL